MISDNNDNSVRESKNSTASSKPIKERRRFGDRRARPYYTVIAEKTLYDVLGEMWCAKFVMAGFALVAVVLAFLFIEVSTRYISAQMIIAPANPIGVAGGVSNLVGHGSEGTIGSAVPAGGKVDAFSVFEAIYGGTTVASFLAQDKEFLRPLRDDHYFIFSKTREKWDAQSLSEYLSKRVHLNPLSGSSSLRRLSYMHPDKKFASELLTRIHHIADEMIRARVLSETNQRIEYLNNALTRTNNPDHRRSLVALLMEQERQKMMVSLDQPYAAAIIEPAFVSSRTYWPDPYIVYPVFIFIGLLIGYFVAVRNMRKK